MTDSSTTIENMDEQMEGRNTKREGQKMRSIYDEADYQ